jgi:hypothetical protein
MRIKDLFTRLKIAISTMAFKQLLIVASFVAGLHDWRIDEVDSRIKVVQSKAR